MKTFGERVRERRIYLGLTQKQLAKKARLSQATVANIEGGRNRGSSHVVQLAIALKVTPQWLVSGQDDRPYSGNVGPGPDTHGLVPLISWVRAGALCDAEDHFQPGDAEAWLPCPVPFGKGTYALRVLGNSMEPEYREGESIYVDPTRAAKHGDDVIVRTPDGRVTFKRLQDTPDGRYLLALNPAYPERIIRVPEGTVVCGVVIGSWMDRRK